MNMHWYEAIVKYNRNGIKTYTDRVIVHARDYCEAMKAVVNDYKEDLHSVLISESMEGDWETYTCNSDVGTRFVFLDDWTAEDLIRPQ